MKIIVAIVILTDKPRVSSSTFKSRTSGDFIPKSSPYESQESAGIPDVISATIEPVTMPTQIRKKLSQKPFFIIVFPYSSVYFLISYSPNSC